MRETRLLPPEYMVVATTGGAGSPVDPIAFPNMAGLRQNNGRGVFVGPPDAVDIIPQWEPNAGLRGECWTAEQASPVTNP